MNCDDFLPALETGGCLRRWAARRHAAHCPACARMLAGWQELKRALAAAPPLTSRQRDLWTSIAQAGAVQPRTHSVWRAAAVALAASWLGFGVFWSLWSRNIPRIEKTAELPQTMQVTIAPISPESIATELFPLEQRLDRMETELAVLSQRVALVDLKRQAALLLEEHRRW